jgi:autotransporter-associated beta strand protein
MLTLAVDSTFSGNTRVSNGTLELQNINAIKMSTFDTSGNGTLSFGTLASVNLGGLTGNGSFGANAFLSGGLNVGNNSASTVYSGNLSGNYNLNKIGTGTLTLSGNNSYVGSTILTTGVLQFQGSNSLVAGSPIGIANGTLQFRNDGAGSGGTISVGNPITLTNSTNTITIDVGNNGGPSTGNTVAFASMANGTSANSLSNTINFTAANGYLQSYASLALSGAGGATTTLNPTTTSITITDGVSNQTSSSTGRDTLALDGTSVGNVISGMIVDGTGITQVVKSNSSVWTLTGVNTYSGSTGVTGGTLVIGPGGALGGDNYGSPIAIAAGCALVMNTGGNQTLAGVISGSGAFYQTGSGVTTLTGSNTLAGPIVISGGTLAVSAGGTISSSPTISLRNGATLDVTGLGTSFNLASGQTLTGTGNYCVNGTMTVGTSATVLPGGSTSSGTLNVGALILNAGSALKYNMGSGQDLINVAGGGLTLNGGGVYLYQSDGVTTFSTPGTYALMNYSGGLAGAASSLSVLNPNPFLVYNFSANGSAIAVNIQTPVTWNGGGNPNFTWSTLSNWSTSQAPANNQSVLFSGSIGLTNSNNIANLSLASMIFSNSAGAFSISGNSIQITGAISNYSTATQTISLNLGLSGGNQAVNAVAGKVILNGAISDGGAGLGISTGGTGTVVLGAANTYSGPTNVNGGSLNLAHSLATKFSTVNVGSNGTLTFATGIVSPTLGGLTGNGSFALATASSQAVALNVGSNGQSTTYGGKLSGPGSLVKQGAGTLTLTNTQSYSGATLITGGVLQLVPAIPGTGIAGDSIGVNFVASGSAIVGQTGPPGAVMSNWNNLTGTSFTNQPLSDYNAHATTATVTVNSSNSFSSGSSDQLLNGYLYLFNNPVTATISGIPYSNYSIYVFSTDANSGYQEQITVGGNNYYYQPLSGAPNGYTQITNTSPGSFPLGDYVKQDGLTGSTQTVTILGVGGGGVAGFCGFEIVSAGVSFSNQAILPAASPVTISNGATLDMTNVVQQVFSLTSTDALGSTVLLGSGALSVVGTVATSFDGTISGSGGSLYVQGGTLTLSGSNTYSGGTFINGGELIVTKIAALADGSSLTVGNAALFHSPSPIVPTAAATSAAMPVPEPGAIVLAAALGGGAVLFRRRHRRYHSSKRLLGES